MTSPCGVGWRAARCCALLLALAACARLAGPEAGEPAPGAGRQPAEPLLAQVRQLSFEGLRSGEGYFSADGRRIVFQSEREPGNPFYQIYRMDLATGDVQRVSPGVGRATCGWLHPAGDRVLFASTHHDAGALEAQRRELEARASGASRRYAWDFDAAYELYEARPGQAGRDGAPLRRLTDAPGYDAEASWSPDGRQILFASNRHAFVEALPPEARRRFEADPSWAMELYLMDADGSNVRRLTHAPGYDGGPFFSSDGRRIVWRRFAEEGATSEILSMDLETAQERTLTHLGALSWAPFFHPSGRYVIFASNLEGFGNFELYVVDAEGAREPVRVTHRDGFDGLPAFSPEGRRLAWTSGRAPDGRSQLFLADWDHAAALDRLGLEAEAAPPRGPAPREPAPRAAIRAEDVREHVKRLASDRMQGRLTGTEGEERATRYVAERYAALGLEPAGDVGSYFEAFEFTSGVSLDEGNRLEVRAPEGLRVWPAGEAWLPLGFSENGEAGAAPLVFAGYGLVMPGDDESEAYDAYADLDVTDRWVLVLRYVPEDVEPERLQLLRRYSSLRYKAMLARDRGARGLIVASGPRSSASEQLVPLRLDGSSAAGSVFGLSVSDALADALLAPSGRSLGALQEELDAGEPKPGFEVPGVELAARVALRRERSQGRNVLARLRGARGDGRGAVLVGAHVDHLGRGDSGGSLAQSGERGRIHPGADDNASGVATMLEIAEALAAGGPGALERDVLFAAWSGEELGLLGSTHHASRFADPHASAHAASAHDAPDRERALAAYLNLDMVGRLRGELIVQGLGSSSLWPREIERANAPLGLPIVTQRDSYLPTDATPFYLAGVPVLNAFTGAHAEYHTPRDTADRLDYEGAARIGGLLEALARRLARSETLPDYVATQRPAAAPGRAGMRVFLGTIPDYAAGDQRGVRLSGVAEDGPAQRAGVRGGDVVVELAGRSVENIYDYTYVLETLRVNEPVTLIVLRDGRRVELSVTPGSRE